MTRFLLSLAGLLMLLVQPADAQWAKAGGKLYTRVADGEVRAAVEITIDPAFHLYDTVLGGPDAIGTAFSHTWIGTGVEWGELRLPKPVRHENPDSPDGWTNVHYDTVIAYARGRLTGAASDVAPEIKVKGLTCEDGGTCVQYSEKLTSKGEGADELFANFPADLQGPAGSSDGDQTGKPVASEVSAEWDPLLGFSEQAKSRVFLRIDGEQVLAAVQIRIRDGYHIYHGPTAEDMGPPDAVGIPTTVKVKGVEGIEWEPTTYPTPHEEDTDTNFDGTFDSTINVHDGLVLLQLKGRVVAGEPQAADFEFHVGGLICDDAGCMPWKEKLTSAGVGPDELFALVAVTEDHGSGAQESEPAVGAEAQTSPGEAAGATLSSDPPEEEGLSLWGFILAAFGAGLLALVMPCTYPMIPITISFFTKQAIARNGKVLPLSLAYGGGIVLMFMAIGAIFGPLIIAFAQDPITNLIIGLMFVLFAFVLFGAINLQPPAFMMNLAGKASSTGGILGVFMMGLTLVITSFTCTAPFIGTLLSAGAGVGGGSWFDQFMHTILGMGVFGLTMAIPFVFLSLVPGKVQSLPQAGSWMDTVKVFMGFVELAASLKFFSNAEYVLQLGILSRETFLALSIAIMACAGAYLFGWIRLKGEEQYVGPVRMGVGVMTFMLCGYLTLGIFGFSMDRVTTSIIPPYSNERLWGSGSGSGEEGRKGHEIIKDDYDRALARAKETDKLLLVNFTGFS